MPRLSHVISVTLGLMVGIGLSCISFQLSPAACLLILCITILGAQAVYGAITVIKLLSLTSICCVAIVLVEAYWEEHKKR